MKHERKFREQEHDYEDRRRKEKRRKGRNGDMGTGEIWAEMFDGDELGYIPDEPTERPQARKPQRQDAATDKPVGPAFQFNQEATIDVKGYKIDLSRVKELTKVQTVHNGKNSFGIDFRFVGAKGLGRTIWYGTNFRQRDDEFAQYDAIWQKVKP